MQPILKMSLVACLSAFACMGSQVVRAEKPNQGNMYITCKDGTMQWYYWDMSPNLTGAQQQQNANNRDNAISRCGPNGYRPEVGGEKVMDTRNVDTRTVGASGVEAGTGGGRTVGVRGAGIQGAELRSAGAKQTLTALEDMTAKPDFQAMQAKGDFVGIRRKLESIGVGFQPPPPGIPPCLPPSEWVGGWFINSTGGWSWGLVCGYSPRLRQLDAVRNNDPRI